MTRFPLSLTAAATALLTMAAPALAQTAPVQPTQGAAAPLLPLSQILSKIETEPDFVGFEEIEWDNRDSSWDIEYRGTGGRTVSVEIVGATGEPRMN